MINNTDRLGYYLVGPTRFYNKTQALLESYKTRYEPVWVFNNDVYGSIDWTIPITEDLPSMYKRRAQQLRDQYDYLVLYFSGGADSMNILHAFVDNNIFLDEIVMQVQEPVMSTLNSTDTSNANFYAEIPYSADVHLNRYSYLLDPRTKVRYQELTKPLLDFLKNDDWYEHMALGTHITLNGIARQIAQVSENHIKDLCEKKVSVAQILGVDKPLVKFDGKNYYAYFMDLNAVHAPPIDSNFADIFNNLYHTEFFYWTPDMPEIVVKQAQEIKRHCELDPKKQYLWARSQTVEIGKFKELMHPIIYPAHIKPAFQTAKPESKVYREQDRWFWSIADDNTQKNYIEVINYIKNNTNSYHMIDHDIMNGLQGHLSPFYLL